MKRAIDNAPAILAGLECASRAGFSVHIEPVLADSFAVTLKPERVIVGEATERLGRFTVVRRELRDALGNALATIVLEVGLDRAAKAARVEAEEAGTVLRATRGGVLDHGDDLREAR